MRLLRRSRWLPVLLLALGLVCGACANVAPPGAAPPAPSPPTHTTDEPRQLVFAVDQLGSGFNPHLLSDLSPVSTAVASLVLPSVFRPGPDGRLVLDTTVASSARVVSTAPFTVSYELSLDAAWSDNTPIAAEDFVYLWERMRREPGVVDSAGYRLITDVHSRAGGKAVDVVFAQRYPPWPTLFRDLLPAHLLKDSPRDWSTALADSIPVSGGPFAVSSVDRDRGQLVLVRNDHYWSRPAVLDTLVLRRSDPTGMIDGLRHGELALAQVRPDQATLAALRQLAMPVPGPGPGTRAAIRLQPVPQPVVVQLGMRTDDGVLTDDRIRRAVAAMLDRDALIAAGTSNGVGGVPVDAQLLAPSTPGYRPTIPAGSPAHPDPRLAAALLTDAGYQRDPAGRWTLVGTQLHVTIGFPADHPLFAMVAEEAGRQLAAAGVDAEVVSAPGAALYTQRTVPPMPLTPPSIAPAPAAGAAVNPLAATSPTAPVGSGPAGPPAAPVGSAGPSTTAPAPPPPPSGVRVDLEVQPRSVGGDLATEAVSAYGCPPGMSGVDHPARNATGLCSAALQPALDAALSTGLTPDQVATTLEPVLWREVPAIPLFQPVTTLASTPAGDRATGDIGPGPLSIGPLGEAATWRPLGG